MKLFKKSNSQFREHIEVSYKVGELIEVLEDNAWQLYNAERLSDGTIYFCPYDVHGFSLNWIYNIDDYTIRQTKETFKRAIEICKNRIKIQQDIIVHKEEKAKIKKLLEEINRLKQGILSKEP